MLIEIRCVQTPDSCVDASGWLISITVNVTGGAENDCYDDQEEPQVGSGHAESDYNSG